MKKERRGTVSVPPEIVEHRIYLVRRQRVMLDADLAALYDVETKTLNRAVKRNRDRFPKDFMFLVTAAEARSLRYQLAPQTATVAAGATFPTLSASKEWRGCRAS